eukprot:scaffold130070_cov17-Tisochrysis_lutea.AAC.1
MHQHQLEHIRLLPKVPTVSSSVRSGVLSGIRFQYPSCIYGQISFPSFAGPLSLALFVPSAVTGCLAYWQWERSIWKVGAAGLASADRLNVAV